MLVSLILALSLSFLNAESPASHHGCWLLESVRWNNKIRPPFNPNLQLYFIFYKNNTLRVYWNFKNDPGTFCERVSDYTYDQEILNEKVLWMHPNNSPECSKDPDMHLGRKMLTPLSVTENEMVLHLNFSGDPLDYIYKKCEQLP